MSRLFQGLELLEGWKEIAARMHCSEKAARNRRKWRPDGLPTWENHLGVVCAFADAIDQWCLRHFLPSDVADQVRQTSGGDRQRTPVIEKRRDSRGERSVD